MSRLLLTTLLITAVAFGQARSIDTAESRLTVFAYKTGLFSFAGHDHEIAAPIASGTISDRGVLNVKFSVRTAEMKVVDPKASEKDRAQIQQDMVSEKVLDAAKYPEIRFVSTRIAANGTEQWTVRGELTLHGQTRPVMLEVRRERGRYTGEVKIKQRDFGIQPISVAGGTVKVKDEVKIVFSVTAK